MMIRPLFPLQTYFKQDNPVEAMVLAIGIGALLVAVLIIHIIRYGVNITRKGRNRASPTPRRFSALSFNRLTAPYGLNKEQTKLLEYVFRVNSVEDPARVLKNSALLDKYFKKTFKTIEQEAETEEDAQQKVARLFTLRNAIDAAPDSVGGFSSTSQISENTPAVLTTAKESHPVRVVSSRGESLVVEVPRNSLGSPVKIGKGVKVTIAFFTKSSKGFSFESRVLGSIVTPHGPALELAHSSKPKALVQRRFRRTEINAKCVFSLVFLDSTKVGRKQPPKLVVDRRRFNGTILDISAGGCSIKTSAPMQVGTRLKIEIPYDDESLITVLGQVLRINRSGGIGTIVSIKFLKVPQRAFNNINTLVFGYDHD